MRGVAGARCHGQSPSTNIATMDYTAIAVAIACMTFWYKGAEMESIPPIYWAGPSVLLSGIIILGLQRGWLTLLLAQVAMFVVITVYRAARDKKPED